MLVAIPMGQQVIKRSVATNAEMFFISLGD